MYTYIEMMIFHVYVKSPDGFYRNRTLNQLQDGPPKKRPMLGQQKATVVKIGL